MMFARQIVTKSGSFLYLCDQTLKDSRMKDVKQRQTTQPRVWQRMLSGRRLDLIHPSPLDIEIEDIAHGLARVPRWNGQTTGENAFSVAEHSVIVEDICRHLEPTITPEGRLMALLHDGPEYVIGDMISPFKTILGDSYKAVENRLETAIHLRFGLPANCPPPLKKLIKRADRACAWFEAVHLAGFSEKEANKLFAPPPAGIALKLSPKSIPVSQDLFLTRFSDIFLSMEAETKT